MDYKSEHFIAARLPHRPPFLWVDRVLDISKDSIRVEKQIPEDLELFQGHYPGHPLMPGVLLCEAIFQAGALLVAERIHRQTKGNGAPRGLPVLTRIQNVKFKREVGPGDTIEIRARLKERLGPAWFLKGTVKVSDKTAVQAEFSCALK